jgi:esterase/lipase superfamily enzyme
MIDFKRTFYRAGISLLCLLFSSLSLALELSEKPASKLGLERKVMRVNELKSPPALAVELPEKPAMYSVSKIACATPCSDEKLSAARQELERKIIRVSELKLEIVARTCEATKSGAREVSTIQKLKSRWSGLSILNQPDNTPATLQTYSCNNSNYSLLALNDRNIPLYVLTPDGLLLMINMPHLVRSAPPPSVQPPQPPTLPSVAVDLPPQIGIEKNVNTVRVFFGTSRAKTDSKKLGEMYGTARGELEVGQLEVSLPPSHKEGDIEQPKWWHFELSENPEKHMVLQTVTPWPMTSFRKNLQEALAKDPDGATFLFIHGYNVSFKDAALRTAQMAWDLKLVSAPLMFSWPSQAKAGAYTVDEDNIAWTVPHLKTFLQEVSSQPGAKKIHVIAHSMGNRALVQALQNFERPNNKPRFNQIILAAADIDADVFKEQIAPNIVEAGQQVTLYTSKKDKALVASKKFHGDKRLGDATGIPLVIPGIDTIDASAIDTDFLGHSYFAGEKKLLNDIRLMLHTGANAEQRKLRRESQGNTLFWSVQ